MATNDVYMLTVKGSHYGSDHIHTLHFREVTPQADGASLLAAYQGAPLTAYRACHTSYSDMVQRITVQKVCGTVPLPSPSEALYADPASKGTRNTAGMDFLPNFLAALVTEKGTLAGRRYNGRFFMGGLVEPDCNGNVIQAAYVTLLTAYCNALNTAFIGAGATVYKLFAFSRLLAEGDPYHTRRDPQYPHGRLADPVTATQCQDAGSDVKQLIVSNAATTMRSRKLGHGN